MCMRAIGAISMAAVLVLAGCGSAATPSASSQSSGGTSSEPETTSPSSSAPGTTPGSAPGAGHGRVIKTAPSDFGTMLFDRSGQAIYLFAKERTSKPQTNKPQCYGACAKAWPPVLTEGSPQARGDTRPGLLGTIRRSDGTSQVTYKGHPLYFYAHEGKNQVLCHNITEYDGLWLVVTPAGEPAPA
jgi:predicted lipoprotein with Yx(FWY)xxD motif